MTFSLTVAVAAVFLWTASTAQELRHKIKIKYETENELEFASVVEQKVATTSDGTSLVVGDFHFNAEQGFALTACDMIEGQFMSNTVCTCSLSKVQSSIVHFGCEHEDVSCNKLQVCGKLAYTGTVGLERPVSTSDFCLKDLHILGEQRSFGDLCVSVDQGYDSGRQKCRAQIGKAKCTCSICDGGYGIRMDCSNADASLVSTRCDEISSVRAIEGEIDTVFDFLPSFVK
jgi:hypothetical protein